MEGPGVEKPVLFFSYMIGRLSIQILRGLTYWIKSKYTYTTLSYIMICFMSLN